MIQSLFLSGWGKEYLNFSFLFDLLLGKDDLLEQKFIGKVVIDGQHL